MTMCDLKRGQRGVVLKVELPVLLKERLRSLGIFTGAKFTMLKTISRKNAFLIEVGSTRVAIDGETAAGVSIWRM